MYLSVRLEACEKNHLENLLRMQTPFQESKDVSDRGVFLGGRGACVVWVFALLRWAMLFFLLLYKRWRRGRVVVKEHGRWNGCQADVSSHLPSFFPPLLYSASILVFFLTFRQSPLTLIFSPRTLGSGGIAGRSQLELGLKSSRDISVFIKTCSPVAKYLITQEHTHTYAHTTWQSEANAFFPDSDRRAKRPK